MWILGLKGLKLNSVIHLPCQLCPRTLLQEDRMHQSSSLLELYLFKAKNNHSLDPGHIKKERTDGIWCSNRKLISFINGMASQPGREGIFIT